MDNHKLISCVYSLRRELATRQRPIVKGNTAEKPVLTPSGLRRTRSSIATKNELVEDFDLSSDHEDNCLSSGGGVHLQSGTKSLRGIVIPASQSTATAGRERLSSAKSHSSSSSLLSSRHDQSSEYDTPGTSAVATPAESAIKVETSSRLTMRGSAVTQTRHQRTLPQSGANGKRKRGEVDGYVEVTMDADALLAHALQEEEYREPAPSRGRLAKARRLIEYSEEVDHASGSSSEFSALEASIDVGRPKAMKNKIGGGIALPSRAARDNARKSIADKATIGILDTEDTELSDVSEFDSEDLESEASVGEEDEDLGQQPDIIAAPATAPSTRRPHRLRRARTIPGSTAARSGPDSWMSSRVSSILSWYALLLNCLLGRKRAQKTRACPP